MQMTKTTWIVGLACGFLAGGSRADVLARFAFNNTRAATDSAPGITVSTFEDGSGFVGRTGYESGQGAPAGGAVPVLRRFPIQDGTWTAVANRDAGMFWTFTVTAAPGRRLNLQRLSFGARRATTSPDRIAVMTSADNYAFGVNWGVTTAWTTYTFDLSGPAYQGLEAITFRIVPYHNSGRAGNFFIDAVVLEGSSEGPRATVLTIR